MDIITQFEDRLRIKNVSSKTAYVYVRIAKALLHKNCEFFSQEQELLISYMSKRVKDGMSSSYLIQHLAVISFIRKTVLGINDKIEIPKPIREITIPDVLTKDEFQKIYTMTENVKHKCILALMYSAGLRCGEVVGLKIKDVDGANNKIIIRKSKGKIDRVVVLDESVLDLLRKYWAVYKTNEYLFEGQKGGVYSTRSIQEIVKNACKKAKIRKKISSHSLRHSCFTQLVKDGVDLRLVQRLAGHKNINTTAGYIRVTDEDVLNIKSPIKSISI